MVQAGVKQRNTIAQAAVKTRAAYTYDSKLLKLTAHARHL